MDATCADFPALDRPGISDVEIVLMEEDVGRVVAARRRVAAVLTTPSGVDFLSQR